MGIILYPDGSQEDYQPLYGQKFQLKELHDIVDGYIEIVPTRDGRVLVINDEGKIQGLPRNAQATALVAFPSPAEVQEMLHRYPDIIFAGDPTEPDYIAGTALLCDSHEVA